MIYCVIAYTVDGETGRRTAPYHIMQGSRYRFWKWSPGHIWDALQTQSLNISFKSLCPSAKTCIFCWWDSVIVSAVMSSLKTSIQKWVHFAGDIFKSTFLFNVLIEMISMISLKFVSKVLAGNESTRINASLHYFFAMHGRQCSLIHYPTLACEFQGFRVWGKFVFRTLELMDTPTNLANQVKVGHTLDQSRSVQLRVPERAHQNNAQSWRSSRTDRRLSRQFWEN